MPNPYPKMCKLSFGTLNFGFYLLIVPLTIFRINDFFLFVKGYSVQLTMVLFCSSLLPDRAIPGKAKLSIFSNTIVNICTKMALFFYIHGVQLTNGNK